MDTLQLNNLKLSPRKTYCFPTKLDLLGWTKVGKLLVPDEHRQNTLIHAPLPETVKDLRSFLGSYRTFFRCKKNISFILGDLEKLVSNNPSSQKIPWTPDLVEKFNTSKLEAKSLDKVYLPNPKDQLVLTSDYSKQGISATLWAKLENGFHVVARMSARLSPTQENLCPCEGEALAHFIAAKSSIFNSPIRSSDKEQEAY